MQLGSQPLFCSSFRSFSLEDKASLKGVGMLGSHPNPLIYVMGPRHSQESIKPILIIVSG
jgi:hypothetical protein